MSDSSKTEDKLADSFAGGEPSATDKQIASLQTRIGALNDKMGEERFLWVLLSIILFDVIAFSHAETWGMPVVIGIFELIFIVVLAGRCGVDAVMPLLDRIGALFGRGPSNGD